MTTITDKTSEEACKKLFEETGVKPRQSWFYAGLYEFAIQWLRDCIDERTELEPDDLLGKMSEYAQEFEEDGNVEDFHPVNECPLLRWHGLSEDLDEIVQENKFYAIVGLFLFDELNNHSVVRQEYEDEDDYFTDSNKLELNEDSPRCDYDMKFSINLVNTLLNMGVTFKESGTVGELDKNYKGLSCPFVETNILL